MFFKRVRRISAKPGPPRPIQAQAPRRQIALALEVDDLKRSIRFWRDVAGLGVTAADDYVHVGGYIALIQAGELASAESQQLAFPSGPDLDRPKRWIRVFVNRSELNEIRQQLERAKVPSVTVAGPQGEWEGVRCLDPDRNVVEFRERNSVR